MKSHLNSSAEGRVPFARHLLSVLILLSIVSGVPQRLDAAESWMFATPEPLPAPINEPGSLSLAPWLSPDGLTLYFTSDRTGGYGRWDLWVAERSNLDAPWGEPVNLGATINTAATDAYPFLSADELTLYFSDANPHGWPGRNGSISDLQTWVATRPTRQSPWNPPTVVGPPVDTSTGEGFANLSADGLTMYFCRGLRGLAEFFAAQRNSLTEPWMTPTRLPPIMNQSNWNLFPFVSGNDLHFFFESNRSGGRGLSDLWMATRPSAKDPWTNEPVNLSSQINTPFVESSPWVSADFPALGSFLLFARNSSPALEYESARIFRAEVIPNLTLLRSFSLGPDAEWTPVAATFAKLSANTIESEIIIGLSGNEAFFRVSLAGDGDVRIESSERVLNKLRIRYTWAR